MNGKEADNRNYRQRTGVGKEILQFIPSIVDNIVPETTIFSLVGINHVIHSVNGVNNLFFITLFIFL